LTIRPTERVCPDCGRPAGQQPFCAGCGINLSNHERLPTREQWEAEHPDRVNDAPAAVSLAKPEVSAPGHEFLPPERPGGQPPPTFQSPAWQPPSTFEPPPADRSLPWHRRPMAAWGYRVGRR
jgi:hypothetical protein